MVSLKYSNFISLNKHFKDVFSLESDLDESDIWKRYIFTNSFKEILSKIDFIFKTDNFKKKGIILSGKYGVGKSHTLAVLSHLLWDDCNSIDSMLENLKRQTDIPGHTLAEFRKNKKFFPVILSGKDSNEVFDEKSFDFRLQIALEAALKKHGFDAKTSEKSEFELYYNWLKNQYNEDHPIVHAIITDIEKTGIFESIDELIEGLLNRDNNALSYIKDLFIGAHMPPPYEVDTFGYYENILQDLQRNDESISGIIIYWDEFTTVFNYAGQSNNVKLLQKIQNWAQKAPSNIILFLISHRSPEAFRGKYKEIDDELALITDRFAIPIMKMEKSTTYELIEKSLVIKDINNFNDFIEKMGCNSKNLALFVNQYKAFFKDIDYDEQKLKNTLPLHPYSVYIATKIANLVGSADRSIFQLLHSNEKINTIYGEKIGFAAFLDLEPSENFLKLFTIDQVFDFFYDDLRGYNFDKSENANVIQTINSFSRYFSIVEKMGNDVLRIFKTIVLMQMLNEYEHDNELLTNQSNIEKAFLKSNIKNIPDILEKLQDNSILIRYDKGISSGECIFKIRFGDFDQESLEDAIKEVKETNPFEKYVARRNEDIISRFQESVADVPRLKVNPKGNNVEIKCYSSNELQKMQKDIQTFNNEGKLTVGLVLLQDVNGFITTQSDLISISKNFPNHIILLYQGPFDDCYGQYIDAQARIKLGQDRSQKQLTNEGDQLLINEKKSLKEKMSTAIIFFQGSYIKQTGGFGKKIDDDLEKIYPLGFDYLKYQEFWKSPKIYSDIIFINYGEANGKSQIDNDSNIKRRINDIFRDKKEHILVDNKLILKDDDYVRSSALFEIVQKIRSHAEENLGSYIFLRDSIDELGLEKPPYGLCGWIESLIITYALAEFKKENRLEVKLGDSTPLKEGNKIIEAIKDAVTHSNKRHQIRYGTASELKLAKKMLSMFSIDEEGIKTLTEVCIKIRHKNNSTFGLPLWVLPYAFDGEMKGDIEECLTPFNKIIVESDRDNIPSDTEIENILSSINEIEKKNNKSIWRTLFSQSTFRKGFEEYVNLHYPQLVSLYNDIDILIENLKMNLEAEPWAWTSAKVSNQLASMLRNTIVPSKPQNIHATLDGVELLLEWDSPPHDTGIPLKYEIQRKDDNTQFGILDTIDAKNTKYRDKTIKNGVTYTYCIIAENIAGRSEPSENISQRMTPVPPPISLEINSFEDNFEINWENPGEQYEINHFKILKGNSPGTLKEIAVKNSNQEYIYHDYDVDVATRYFYRIDAYNVNGLKCTGSLSSPVVLTKTPPPEAPRNASIALFEKGVKISWSHPEDGIQYIDQYCLYKEDANQNKKSVIMIDADQTDYYDNSVIAGKTYSYSISAKNCIGESAHVLIGSLEIPFVTPPEIEKWEGETISVVKSDSQLFFRKFNHILKAVLVESSDKMTSKERIALKKIKKIIEDIINE